MAIKRSILYADNALKDQIIADYMSGMSALACSVKHFGRPNMRAYVKRIV